MGGNGLPLAKRTEPELPWNASSYVHSALSVGFDSGKMIGRSFMLDIACRGTPTIVN